MTTSATPTPIGEDPRSPAAESDDLNYVPYFSEIEEAFIERRGKSMFIGPIDWALIESWKARGIPLHVVLRSIEEVFDSAKSRAQTRRFNSLRYCQDEVETQFTAYINSRVGSHDLRSNGSEPSASADGSNSNDRNPFSKTAIAAHLERCQESLRRAVESVPPALAGGSFPIALHTAIDRLGEVRATIGTNSFREIEEELTQIERMIELALHVAATPDQVMDCRAKVERAMGGYARHMTEAAYRQTFEGLLAKALRELFGMPRLSLFHMKG